MLFAEFINDAVNHILVVNTAIAVTGSPPALDDPKSDLTYVQSLGRASIGWLVEALKNGKDKSLLWSFCRLSKGLAVNSDGYYVMGLGNLLNDATYDGSEANTSGADVLVSGDILAVEVTFSTAASAVAPPGPSNPFASASWQYSEGDSASAIRRARALASRHGVNVPSHELVTDRIYTPARGVRLTFFPSDFGALASDMIPNGCALACLYRLLASYYGQKGGSSGVQAAIGYNSMANQQLQTLIPGTTDFGPPPPYQGN